MVLITYVSGIYKIVDVVWTRLEILWHLLDPSTHTGRNHGVFRNFVDSEWTQIGPGGVDAAELRLHCPKFVDTPGMGF